MDSSAFRLNVVDLLRWLDYSQAEMPAAAHVYGPYRVIRPLGSGGMGMVLLAEDPRLGRFVALKTVSGQVTNSPHGHDQLLSEARAAARLSHPNIATVHDVLDISGQTVIVYEFVEGETLAERLKRGRLPVAEAIRIGAELAEGLAAAHAQGLIHRDLKPGNVMLASDGRAKILDFGIARIMPSGHADTMDAPLTTAGLFAGTPGYAAPEQWLGEAMGGPTDLYALGVVLFEMLSGRRPFDAPSRLSLMQQVIEAKRPRVREWNAQVPAAAEKVIDAALSRDPSRRPGSAREVAAILRAVERELTPRSGTSSASSGRRGRRWWLAAAAVLLGTVVALVATVRTTKPASADSLAPVVVAVLPLANATGVASNDYLAAGIADSLTTSLASLNGITVLSRAAVMGVWTRETEPSKVAQELGASYLVEGSVQQSGDRVQLSVNLVRPDRSLAWGDSVEGNLDRVFELQSRLAASLGRALSVQLSAVDRARLAEQPTRNPQALDAYFRGRALLERRDVKGNVDAALAAFDEAVQLDAKFAIAHAARGEALWARYLETRDANAAQDAIAAGTTALRLDADRPSVRYSLALSLAGSGRLDDAVDELQRALALQANYDDARRELGSVLARQGKLDDAVVEFRRAIALRPNYWGHHSALGLRLFQAARYAEAEEAFKRAIALQPDNHMGYQQLGTVYQSVGRDAEALANYQRALAIRPSAQAYTNVGVLLHAKGDYAGAIDAYKKSLELRPNSHITNRNLGDAYQRLGRRKEAVQSYRRAAELAEADLAVNRRDADTLAALAVYLAKVGDLTRATARLNEAMALGPPDVEVLFSGAVVHALSGRRPEALAALKTALDQGYSRQLAAQEEDFATLRKDPEFARLTAPPKQE